MSEAVDVVFQSFLRKQAAEAQRLEADSDILSVVPLDGPFPQHYIARFCAKGLIRSATGEIIETTGFDVGIFLPDDYLRQVQAAQVLTYLGPHHEPWHPNIRPPFICIHLVPGMALTDLLRACYDLWTWNLYSTRDEGVNHAAAQWARHELPERFPIDRRPLRRRTLDLNLTSCSRGQS
jgi:hypothetical protein